WTKSALIRSITSAGSASPWFRKTGERRNWSDPVPPPVAATVMDRPTDPPADPTRPDEVNRLWQHGMHEERLFHDRVNYFSAIQVGLLGVFAILYQKEPAPGVFAPPT